LTVKRTNHEDIEQTEQKADGSFFGCIAAFPSFVNAVWGQRI